MNSNDMDKFVFDKIFISSSKFDGGLCIHNFSSKGYIINVLERVNLPNDNSDKFLVGDIKNNKENYNGI